MKPINMAEQGREINRLEERVRVERRALEYILQGNDAASFGNEERVIRSSLPAAPRFIQHGVHIFDEIAVRNGITAVAVDRNFKIGAKSKKGKFNLDQPVIHS